MCVNISYIKLKLDIRANDVSSVLFLMIICYENDGGNRKMIFLIFIF